MALAYSALALQTLCRAVNRLEGDEAHAAIADNIARIGGQIVNAKRFLGADMKLVVLPEYAVTSFPWGEDAAAWREKAAFEIDGPEYEAFAKIANEAGVFIAGNHYERDPHFPELYFQASTVIAPSGETVLRYRRLISMFAPSPFDVWDAYLEAYGEAAVFPVADTEIGRLSAIASEEILYPEIARIHASRGAEVFVHSSSEVSSPDPTPKSITRRARAVENMAYIVSANSGGLTGIDIPENSTDGGSEIVGYKGHILAKAGPGESINAVSEIDIDALRRYRRRPGMGNLLSRHPMELWAGAYQGASAAERNGLGDGQSTPARAFYVDRQRRVIDKLDKAGLI
ncbi:MAG: nitrilase-related carbon-nitrogen hydrolase [Pseudomonadota bacterium]